MPEYLAPGIYVEEYDSASRSIPGVSTPPRAPTCGPLARPRFFAGRLLDAATLEAEQDYQRERLRRHNRALHGFGIVSGLDVDIDTSGDEPRVAVAPGYAIDGYGDEIMLCERATLQLPVDADEAFVSLRCWLRACDPVAGPNGPEATRIEEACVVAISARVPKTAIALARMVREPSGWSIDGNSAAPSAGSIVCREP
ncbi:MAG: hypothetical protein PVSMB1_01080 [Gemmatimonadaceae bacterium]